MKGPVSKLELIAYADGELSPARTSEVERLLANNPELRAEVQSLRQLRLRAAQVLSDVQPNPSLRRAVEKMFDENEAAETPVRSILSVTASRSIWSTNRYRLAAAAVVAAAVTGWFVYTSVEKRNSSEVTSKELLIELRDGSPPAGLAANTILVAVQKHVTCQQMADHFYDNHFPKALAELPKPASGFLGVDPLLPDLSSLGYRFAGAGGCRITGGKTLHALYRAESSSGGAISVFVQPFEQQVTFNAGKLLLIAGPTSKHDMLAWRTDKLVFFVISGDAATTRQAADQMAPNLRS